MSLVVIVLGCISIATAHINELANEDVATTYLKQYGYLDDDDNALSLANTTTAFNDAVSLFQEYFQLPGDGILNNVTLQQMRRPRCGLPDIPHHMHVAQKWPKTHLTWNFHLGDQNMIIITEAAFALWAEHSSLTFERKIINPDIVISFRRGVHTLVHSDYVCPSKLDGPGNTLAHAFYPTGSPDGVSEVHIDSEEQWHISLNEKTPSNATSLLQTLIHEIGHSLGLPHSTRNESVMYPYAPAGSGFLKLSIEDILAIQQLYGKRKTRRETTTTMTTTTIINKPNNDTDLCDVKCVDSVLILDHRIFIVYKHQIWMIDINDKTYSKPLLIKDILYYLPDDFIHLQAAYQRPSGDIVMFVNNLVYLISYPGFKQVESRPKTFADLRLPPNTKINAAINTNKGRTFIIFNDINVAELDECSMRAKAFYPLQTIFPGIPPTITSAFRYTDGNLYFMDKRQQFYKFNEFYRTIVSAEKFDFNVIGIECPKQGILLQLRELLNRLIKAT